MLSNTRHQKPLCRLGSEGDQLVLRLSGWPAWLALRRRVAAPLSSVTDVREVAPYEPLRLTLRLWGTGGFGLCLGLFWRRGRGRCFVARRRGRI